MFESHFHLQAPKISIQPLWRYFPLERFSDLLLTEELFFTHLPKFSDGLEGRLTARTRIGLATWFQQQNRSDLPKGHAEAEKYEEGRNDFFANCWHMNEHESNLMWRAYADRGVCIKTTYERLVASLKDSPALINGGVVRYLNFDRDLGPVGNVFHHVITKDLPYSDEREFRLLLWRSHNQNLNLEEVQGGIRIKVDLKMLVKEIYVNPELSAIPSDIENLINRKGIRIAKSSLRINK